MTQLFEVKTTIDTMRELLTNLDNGTATVEDFRHFGTRLMEQDAMIQKEIDKTFTLAQLKSMGFYSHGKKDEYVKRYWDSMVNIAVCRQDTNYQWVWGMNREAVKEAEYSVIRKALERLTDEHLDKFRASRVARKEYINEQVDQYKKALENPETLDEFKIFIEKKGRFALTNVQLTNYDELVADRAIENQKKEQEKRAQVAQVALEDTDIIITEGFHTKKNVKIWTAKLSDKVDREVWEKLTEKAKQFGGYYSRFTKGWVFSREEDALSFGELQEGDADLSERWQYLEEYRQENAKERFLAMAYDLDNRAYEIENRESKTHTWRMANMRKSSLIDAAEMRASAKTLRLIAFSSPYYLNGIRFFTQVQKLERVLNEAWNESVRAENDNRYIEPGKRRPFEMRDIVHTKFSFIPWVSFYEIRELARLSQESGTILASRRIAKLIASVKEGESVQLKTRNDVEALRKIAYRYSNKNWTAKSIKDRFIDIERITRMGISSLPHLRTALREYARMRAEVEGISPIQKAILDIAGMDIPDFHPTPENESQIVIDNADIRPEDKVLEPSAGWAAIADMVREQFPYNQIDVIEINSSLRTILEAKSYNLVGYDFLEFEGEYDVILGNVPFSNMQDVRHVRHAYNCLNENGRLSLIVGDNVRWRESKEHIAFRQWLDKVGGTIESLDPDAFKDSDRPTATRSALVVIHK